MPVLTRNLTDAGPCDYVATTRTLMVGQADGRVWAVRLDPQPGRRRRRQITRVTAPVAGVAFVATLDRLSVVTDDGRLWLGRPLSGRAGAAKLIAAVAANAAALVSDGTEVVVLERGAAGDVLIAVDPTTGAELARFDVSLLAPAPIVSMVADGPRRVATVLADGTFGGFELDTQVMTTNAVSATVGSLAWVDQAAGWLATTTTAGLVGALRVDVANPPISLLTPTSPIVASACSETGELLAVEAERVTITTLPAGFTTTVTAWLDDTVLFPGAYTRLHLSLAGTGFAFEDVVYDVSEVGIAEVSPSIDETFEPGSPHVLVYAGGLTGPTKIRVVDGPSGTEIGVVALEVADVWDDPVDGPPLVVVGEVAGDTDQAAWGGGGAGPQNVDVHKAPGTWKVGFVLVDTTSARHATGAALTTLRDTWLDHFERGVPVGGASRCVVAYYKELSYDAFTMARQGDVAGPIQMTKSFDDYFKGDGTGADMVFLPKDGTAVQAFVTAVEDANKAATNAGKPKVLDLTACNAVVFVVRSVATPTTAMVGGQLKRTSAGKFAWPVKSGATVKLDGKNSNLRVVFMPHDWTTVDVLNSRPIHTTLAHELGHTLGLPDLYWNDEFNASTEQRQVNTWDLMGWDGVLPQMTVPNRLMLGWVPPGHVKSYDFQAGGGAAVNDLVQLQAMETKAIGAGRVRGVEVRVTNGQNYYFEYRAEQAGQIGDQDLTLDRRVVGTDVISDNLGNQIDKRRQILQLIDDPDAVDDTDGIMKQGAILGVNQDYIEKDFTAQPPKDFKATVVSVAGDSAALRVQYDSQARPELSIQPWPSPNHTYQSPDIDIVNDKNDPAKGGDTKWRNVPWKGHNNTIRATFRNIGALGAKQVPVVFRVKNLEAGSNNNNPSLLQLGQTVQDIPAKGTVVFEHGWFIPEDSSNHFCVEVMTPLYEEPGNAAVHESSDRDNWAQSNYDKFYSDTGSPARRQLRTVTVRNPLDREAAITLLVHQTSPFYRTYLEHRSVTVPAQGSRPVTVMVESLDGDPAMADHVREHGGRDAMWEQTARIDLHAWTDGVCVGQRLSGVSLEVATGRRTAIVDFRLEGGAARGRVITVEDGNGVGSGKVLVSLRDPREPEREESRPAFLDGNGEFVAEVGHTADGTLVQAHYLGSFSFAACDSEVVRP